MKKTGICRNNKVLLEETSREIDGIRRLPRVRTFFWFLRCADALDRYASVKTGRNGYGRTMIAVLQILLEHPRGISQQSIAKQTGRTKQLVVMAIDKLEKGGYAVRKPHSSDRRVNSICITEAGIKYVGDIFPQTLEVCDQTMSSLTQVELEQTLPVLIKLTKGVWEKLGTFYHDKTYGQPDPDKY